MKTRTQIVTHLQHHLGLILPGLPEEVRALLIEFPKKAYVAGGFVRDSLIAVKPRDIDIFVADSETYFEAKQRLEDFSSVQEILADTPNAVTYSLWNGPAMPTIIQLISHSFGTPAEIIQGFDWSNCQAAVYWDGSEFVGICSLAFSEDIINQQIRYNAEGGGKNRISALLRGIRFINNGWRIEDEDLAAVLADFIGLLLAEPNSPRIKNLILQLFQEHRKGYPMDKSARGKLAPEESSTVRAQRAAIDLDLAA